MKRVKTLLFITSALLSMSLSSFPVNARKWNNPENERRYENALRQQAKYRKKESEAWRNYDRKLEGAENTTKCVRNSALRGNVKPIGCARHIR